MALEVRVRVVSSYHPGSGALAQSEAPQVLPKSRESARGCREIREIAREIVVEPVLTPSLSKVLHVLITGEGFEIRDGRGGYGVPETRDILAQMGPPFYRAGAVPRGQKFFVALDIRPEGFPVPVNLERVKQSALDEDLDGYWNRMLEDEVVTAVEPNIADTSSSAMATSRTSKRWRLQVTTAR